MRRGWIAGVTVAAMAGLALGAAGPNDDFPAFDKVSEGFEKVVTSLDEGGLYTLWRRDKDAQMLAELPRNYEGQRFYIVPTVAGGDRETGVYSIWHYLVGQGTRQLYWSRRGDQLALIEPNLSFRTSGDAESSKATERIYTDRVVLSVPIAAMGPGGGPVIDLDQLMIGMSDNFFGGFTRGANRSLTRIMSAKAFPHNVDITWELPRANGTLAQIHYSIGAPPKTRGFASREADRRVGFFYTNYTDRGKNDGKSQTRRLAHRWNLEKRDPSLRLSPPKEPIVYYIEHTTPVRYRRWVSDGILAWNRAFEQVGILGAIEVRQQDAQTGAYMDIDPEDIRYSFVRWTNSHMGFAIGPSHAHPETGEIYEADIVMDEQFIAGWAGDLAEVELARTAMRSFGPETVQWLDQNPQWDPRVLLAGPTERDRAIAYQAARFEGREWQGEVPPTMTPAVWAPLDERVAARGGVCSCLQDLTSNVASMRALLAVDPSMFGGDDESVLDGVPETFVGPLLKSIVMHEVGHTMGLMHNWKGSTYKSFDEINGEGGAGEGTFGGSVMDYYPLNLVVADGEIVQGDWCMTDIGPYDMWAIRWGYTDKGHEEIAKEAWQPGHEFSSDEGAGGPDPHARTWDLGENSLDFSESQIVLADHIRGLILEKGVKDGDSWQRARELFSRTISIQFGAVAAAEDWIGGSHTAKPHKGDPDAPEPIVPVSMDRQRRALRFVLDNAFEEKAWGLSPEILAKLGVDGWFDAGGNQQQDLPFLDSVMGLQSTAMTMLINPTKLRRILENEVRVGADADALTVPEVLRAIRDRVWEPTRGNGGDNRAPMLSTLKRNLQRDHVGRLISLATGPRWSGAAGATIASLARQELRETKSRATALLAKNPDDYSRAHLMDSIERIDRALEASYLLEE